MAVTIIATGDTVAVERFENSIFREYTQEVWWKNFMSAGANSIIQVKEDLMKQAGDAITINLRGKMQGGKVTGSDKGIGNEGRVDFFGQRLEIDLVRHIIKTQSRKMTQKRAGFNVQAEVKDALVEKSVIDLDEEITLALSGTSTGRVRGRYLYGAVDSNWDDTHATGLQNVDNTDDQLTTNIMRIAKRKATMPVNATAKIRPMKVKNGKNTEAWFVFVGHPYSLRDMFDNDAAWKNAQLNIPPMANAQSPLFTGSSFKGAYDGILIYEYERINLISSTIQVSHNFLLGAQAAAVVWGQRSKFAEEESDIGHDISQEVNEIRGVEKLVFDRATAEDQGVVHIFAAAVAD